MVNYMMVKNNHHQNQHPQQQQNQHNNHHGRRLRNESHHHPSSSSSSTPSFLFFFSLLFFFLLFSIKNIYAAYNLPAGVKEQIGLDEIKETFHCEADGYFADVDNKCKIYHQCNSFRGKKKKANTEQKQKQKFQMSTMACGPNQMFDQSKLTCKYEDDAIPCEASSDFFYLNERIGDETADFLTDADLEKAKNARPSYRAKRRIKRKQKNHHNQLQEQKSSALLLLSPSSYQPLLNEIQNYYIMEDDWSQTP